MDPLRGLSQAGRCTGGSVVLRSSSVVFRQPCRTWGRAWGCGLHHKTQIHAQTGLDPCEYRMNFSFGAVSKLLSRDSRMEGHPMQRVRRTFWIAFGLGASVVMTAFAIVALHPTRGLEADGFVPAREIHATVFDAAGNPLAGVVVEARRGDDPLSRHESPPDRTSSDEAGRMRFGAGCHGVSDSHREYLWGMVKTARGSHGERREYLWGFLRTQKPAPPLRLVLLHEGREVAAYTEDQLLRLPVARTVAVEESLFRDREAGPYAFRDGRVEVSEAVCRTTVPADSERPER